MSVLAGIKKRDHASVPDVVWGMFERSIRQNESDMAAALRKATTASNQLDAVTRERDRLLNSNHELNEKVGPLITEVSKLGAEISTLTQDLKQARAQIALEQSAAARKVEEAAEASKGIQQTVERLQKELLAERETSSSLRGELAGLKRVKPAPAPAPAPKPLDPSGLEFEVGNIVRGPNGIQAAKIKLVRTNS